MELPDEAYAASLAGFDRMTAARLDVLLDGNSPRHVFEAIAGDRPLTGLPARVLAVDGLLRAWRENAAARNPALVWEQCLALGIAVTVRGCAGYPAALLHDPAPAPVLFFRGDLGLLAGRRVGIVGTRNATGAGRSMATMFGRDLAASGVHVVSGLARGIDGCAHRGALSEPSGAAPIGVVGCGLDIVYPREHEQLWRQVGEVGLLVSEAPPGTAPEPFRFPLRNRIIAALSEVLVVVESRETGGSLITASEAAVRSVHVMAVPGSPTNRAAAGTNALLREGCSIAADAADVLTALGLDSRRRGGVAYDPRPRPTDDDRVLLELCAEARTLDQLVLISARSTVECAMALARLEAAGWLRQVNGWFERVHSGG